MLYGIMGGAGAGKTTRLMNIIKEALKPKTGGHETFLVIVPDQFSFEYERRIYKYLGPQLSNQVTIFSFSRLAEELFKSCGRQGGKYINDGERLVYVYLAMKGMREEGGFSFYRKQAGNPLFAKSAAEMLKELSWSAITPETLLNKSVLLEGKNASLGEKLRDIALLASAYQQRLREQELVDPLKDLEIAAQRGRKEGYFQGYRVFIDQFQSFSFDELALLKVIMESCGNLTIALTTDDPLDTGGLFGYVNQTFGLLKRMAEELSIGVKTEMLPGIRGVQPKEYGLLEHVSGYILRPQRPMYQGAPPKNAPLRLMEAGDMYEEAEWAAGEISRLTREEGVKWGEIALLTRQLEDYSPLIEAAFRRYDIEGFFDGKGSVTHQTLALFIKGLLELASRRCPATDILFRYAKTGLAGLSLEEVSLLENWAFKWNVEGEDWLKDFPQVEEGGQDVEAINLLQKKLLDPILSFKNATSGKTSGSSMCEALYTLLESLELEKNLTGFGRQDLSLEEWDSPQALTLRRELKQLWNLVMDILDTLHRALGEQVVSLEDFKGLFSLLLGEAGIASPPQTLDAVLVADIEKVSMAAPKAVILLGANEGLFPKTIKSTGLLSDMDKSHLEAVGLKFSVQTKQKLAQERFAAYYVLSAPSWRLYVSWSRKGLLGQALYPSNLIQQIKGSTGVEESKTSRLPLSFFCATKEAAYYQYVQRIGYNKTVTEASALALRAFLEQDELYGKRVALLDELALNRPFTLENSGLIQKLWGSYLSLSASRLEDYIKCPFMYFCKKALKIYPLNPLELDPANQGNAIHYALAGVMSSAVGNKEVFINLSQEDLEREVRGWLKEYYDSRLGGAFGKSQRFLRLYAQLEKVTLEVLSHIQRELSQSSFEPIGCEVEIKRGGTAEPVILKINDLTVAFVGVIDRVDCCEIGGVTYLRVVDYKSGVKKFKLEDIFYGLNLQMLLYLFTLTEKSQHPPFGGAQPAGVLYMPASEALPLLPREADEKEVIRHKEKTHRMNGLLLDEEGALEAMEKGITGIYIPVKAAKEGYTKASSLISHKGLEVLKNHAMGIIKAMAKELLKGHIQAAPMEQKGHLPCDYCDYWSVCGNQPPRNLREYRAEEAKVGMLNMLKGDQDFGQGEE